MHAVKKTPELLAYCHQLPIEKVKTDFNLENEKIKATVTVNTTAKTGVEMEALIGVSICLNTIWDMVKYLEKDADGQYPHSRITDIIVEKKVKG